MPARYSKPSSQIWAEQVAGLSEPEAQPEARKFVSEDHDTSAYVGVSPEYQTYSDEVDMPRRAEKGVEKVLEDQFAAHSNRIVAGEPVEEEYSDESASDSEEGEAEGEQEAPAANASQSTPPAPPAGPAQTVKTSPSV